MTTLRNLIREMVREAMQTMHYASRVAERLMDPDKISPPLSPKVTMPLLDLLEKIDFPRNVSVGVRMFQSGVVYRAFTSDKLEPSVGNVLWAVVRNNELITTLFSREGSTPNGVQYITTMAKLKRLVDERGSYLITTNDLQSDKPQKDVRRRGAHMNLPMVTIGGRDWYADVDNEILHYAKNINKTMTFNDMFSTLSEPELDSILDQLSTPTT